MSRLILVFSLMICGATMAIAQKSFDSDTIKTSAGDLKITFIGHASLMFQFGNLTIDVDPWGEKADYSKLPKADLILITHEHYDHLDPAAIDKISTPKTQIVLTAACFETLKKGTVLRNGDSKVFDGIKVEAVPAYNLQHMNKDGKPFHPKGSGNGYILTFGDKRVYLAGDTENIPEMKSLKGISIAFLPMNLPYTMTPEMVADAAKALKPAILYPYHYGDTDVSKLVGLMKTVQGVDVRVRPMK